MSESGFEQSIDKNRLLSYGLLQTVLKKITMNLNQKYAFETQNAAFLKNLRKKVDQYFAEHNLHSSGGNKVFSKGILMVGTAILLYVTLVFFTPVTPVALILCMLLGLNFAAIGFNVMHEGGHQSFSQYLWINKISAHFLNVLGGNAHYWRIKHNVNHHTYTNVEGLDSDIDVKPFMRLHADQPLRSFHRFQHIYWVVLYGVSYLAWIFYDDFKKYFSGKITPDAVPTAHTPKEHFVFWLTKLTYIGLYMVIPMYVVGILPWLVGFLVGTITCGLAISIVFQLAHVVESTEFHTMDEIKSEYEWAVHQLHTTANFATSNKLLHFLLGGLNFQIEHHLFPRISHIHFPAISKLVRETCEEYNIVYQEYSSMFSAIASHWMHIKKMGRVPVRA